MDQKIKLLQTVRTHLDQVVGQLSVLGCNLLLGVPHHRRILRGLDDTRGQLALAPTCPFSGADSFSPKAAKLRTLASSLAAGVQQPSNAVKAHSINAHV